MWSRKNKELNFMEIAGQIAEHLVGYEETLEDSDIFEIFAVAQNLAKWRGHDKAEEYSRILKECRDA